MPPEPTLPEALALLAQRDARIVELETELKLLRQKVDLLVRKIFGKKSEQLSSAQLELLLGETAEAPPPKTDACGVELDLQAARRKPPVAPKKDRRMRRLDDLPVREEIIEPKEVLQAPERFRRIGEETTERLDYEPGRFLCLRTVRPTYALRRQPAGEPALAPLTAPLPPMLQERSTWAPGLVAHVVVSKYADHLPLYRQEDIYRLRHGVELPRQSLARVVELAAFWLQLICLRLRERTFAGGYVQIDETVIRYLAPKHGQTKQGYFWTVLAPNAGGEGFFHWSPSRGAKVLAEIVPAEFAGRLQADGYEAYPAFLRQREAEDSPPIVLVGCLAHARRKFFEAHPHSGKLALWVIRQIDQLYALEEKLRQDRACPRLREVARALWARPVLTRLHKGLQILFSRRDILPRSALGQAVRYTLGLWDRLEVFVEDGRLEIDNNRVENAIRPTAVGKKNWLFIGSEAAGPRAAIIYTVLASCRRHGVDPFEYLRDVFTRLPAMTTGQIDELLPAAWADARRAQASVVNKTHTSVEALPLAA